LLLLATIHCAASLFFVNYSYLDLKAYANGSERMPYQGRMGMMPVLRLAERSPEFLAMTARVDRSLAAHKRSAFKSVSVEELASMIAGLVSLLAAVSVAAVYGWKRFRPAWWLPPALLLGMLYVTQSARYETTLWYPYDLPHAALFGTACVLLMEGGWMPVLLLFLADIPMRETGIFLVPVCLAVGWARGQMRQAAIVSALMLAAWIPFRLYVRHRFAANPSELGIHWHSTLEVILNPLHWPQIASAFGFLLVPLCLANAVLSRAQRAFMAGALPCLLVTLGFGVWPETRIFGEWLLPAAVLLTAEAMAIFPPRMLLQVPIKRVVTRD
jgi:hypothetical protein